MADQRKPPIQNKRGRPDGAPLPSDSGGFSIESTTMRLKSMRLRRAEGEREQVGRPPDSQSDSVEAPRGSDRPAGRIRHDERGVAVWDWAVATGEFATLSATHALKKLELDALKIEETSRTPKLSLEKSGRDKGGGFDPYNQRGSGKRQGEAATRQGLTGSKDREAVLDQLLGNKK
jgi:hypothetical protein